MTATGGPQPARSFTIGIHNNHAYNELYYCVTPPIHTISFSPAIQSELYFYSHFSSLSSFSLPKFFTPHSRPFIDFIVVLVLSESRIRKSFLSSYRNFRRVPAGLDALFAWTKVTSFLLLFGFIKHFIRL